MTGNVPISSESCDRWIFEDMLSGRITLEDLIILENDVPNRNMARVVSKNKGGAIGVITDGLMESLIPLDFVDSRKSRLGDIVWVATVIEEANHFFSNVIEVILLAADALGSE